MKLMKPEMDRQDILNFCTSSFFYHHIILILLCLLALPILLNHDPNTPPLYSHLQGLVTLDRLCSIDQTICDCTLDHSVLPASVVSSRPRHPAKRLLANLLNRSPLSQHIFPAY